MLKNIYAEKNNTFIRCIIIVYIYISYKYRQNIRAHLLFIWTLMEWVKMKIIQLFFALIEDFGCSFKLNFDGRGGQKW